MKWEQLTTAVTPLLRSRPPLGALGNSPAPRRRESVEVKGATPRRDTKVWPHVAVGEPAANTAALPGSGISMTRSKPSHPQHTAPNYCTALPVCSPGPVLPVQCQDVNTALLTLHTVCAHGYV